MTARHDRRISFRVSNEDYEEMLRVCHERGTVTISELARAALQAFIASKSRSEVSTLYACIEELRHEVRSLKVIVEGRSRSAGQDGAAEMALGTAVGHTPEKD